MQLKFSFEPIRIHIFVKVSSRLAVMYLRFEVIKIEQVPVMQVWIHCFYLFWKSLNFNVKLLCQQPSKYCDTYRIFIQISWYIFIWQKCMVPALIVNSWKSQEPSKRRTRTMALITGHWLSIDKFLYDDICDDIWPLYLHI